MAIQSSIMLRRKETALCFPLRLTPGGKSYVRELSITNIGAGSRVAAWIETDRHRDKVCWRVIRPDGLGRIVSADPVQGAPASPQVFGANLVWLELDRAKGTLLYAELDIDGESMGTASPVKPLLGINCGDFSCALDSSGTLWLLVETWFREYVTLRLLAYTENGWEDYGPLKGERGFRVRPRLVAGNNGLMAAWDEFIHGTYRVVTAELSGEKPVFRGLPAPNDCWETLSAIACAGDGTWYAARCREKLVELKGGMASYHSEPVVSALTIGAEKWRDIASVDIDHTMNPFVPYVGKRRFPKLLGDGHGAWLLWEEKENRRWKPPFLGRLCALSIKKEGDQALPMVVFKGLNSFKIEKNGLPGDLLVATKTQSQQYEQRLPYYLHHVNLYNLTERCPGNLDSNKDAPTFVVHPISPHRPVLKPENLRLFFGDPHLHSRFSQEVEGEQDELYHFARYISHLDFVAFTENDFLWHAEPLSKAAWQFNCRNAEFFNKPGEFTALLGWEYTKHAGPDPDDALNSHRSVLFPGNEGEVHSCLEVPTPKALAKRFRGRRVLLNYHHESPGFDLIDNSLERNIEICSGWCNFMMSPEFVNKVHELLLKGFRLGFYGASDNHERNPGLGGGLTGVWATENTRGAIFEAFWNRRIFATTGLRPDLRFRVSGAFMGGEVITETPPLVQVDVRCDAPIRKIEIVRDGSLVHSEQLNTRDLSLTWQDDSCPPGEHFYYVHILFEGEEVNPHGNIASAYGVHAWSSPVWVIRKRPSR